MKKILLTLALVLCFAVIVNAQEDASEDMGQSFEGFNLQGYDDNGDKAWDVNGESADVEGTKVKIKNVNANAYGDQTVNVTADIGVVDQVEGTMHLEQDVIITSEEGTQLMTDYLDWDRASDTVETDDKVLITDEYMTVKGTGMEAKAGLKNATIKEDVTLTVDTQTEDVVKTAGQFVTITSDGPMVIDQANEIAILEDNVKAVQLDRTLIADRMEVYFNQKENEITKMICIGNVVIIQGENKSYAQKAIYLANEQKVTLSGRPKIIMKTEGDTFATSGN